MKQHNISLETILARNSAILANDVGTETVMMSIERSKYYGMNKTGTHIWKLLEQPMTVAALCSKLAADYQIDESKCIEEVLPFIQQMCEEQILVSQ